MGILKVILAIFVWQASVSGLERYEQLVSQSTKHPVNTVVKCYDNFNKVIYEGDKRNLKKREDYFIYVNENGDLQTQKANCNAKQIKANYATGSNISDDKKFDFATSSIAHGMKVGAVKTEQIVVKTVKFCFNCIAHIVS